MARKKISKKDILKGKDRYEIIAGTFPDIIYEIDASGNFTFVSDAIKRLGYTSGELVGRHFKEIIHPDDYADISRDIVLPRYYGKKTGDENAPKLFDERRTGERMTKNLNVKILLKDREVRIKVKNPKDAGKRYCHAEIISSGVWDKPVQKKRKKLLGSIGVIKDISERKKAEEEYKKAYEEIKKLDRLKTEFVATVSHELRTPLAIIKEGLLLVLEGVAGNINEKQRDMLQISEHNIERLNRIINELLDISKIESGRVIIKRLPANIALLVKEACAKWRPNLEKKKQTLNMSIPSEPANTYADHDRITEVLDNLISNAARFTPENGEISVGLRDFKDRIEVFVSDTGVGISEEDLPRVFGKFQQFGRISGAGEKGTGLGLAISKSIIEMHKGAISVDSKINKGTTFTFAIPKYTAESLFKECLADGVKDALKKGSQISLVTASIKGFELLEKEKGRESVNALLDGLEEVLKKTLRRSGDIAFRKKGRISVILFGCAKENALRVNERLSEAFSRYLKEKGQDKNIEMTFACATCPDDAKNDAELMNKSGG